MKTITVIGTCMLILCFAAAGMSFAADKGDVPKSDVKKEAPSGLDKSKPSADQENRITSSRLKPRSTTFPKRSMN